MVSSASIFRRETDPLCKNCQKVFDKLEDWEVRAKKDIYKICGGNLWSCKYVSSDLGPVNREEHYENCNSCRDRLQRVNDEEYDDCSFSPFVLFQICEGCNKSFKLSSSINMYDPDNPNQKNDINPHFSSCKQKSSAKQENRDLLLAKIKDDIRKIEDLICSDMNVKEYLKNNKQTSIFNSNLDTLINQNQQPTNWTPWLIGGGMILLVLAIGIYRATSRKRK